MKRHIILTVLAVVASWAAPLRAQDTAHVYTLAEAYAIGKALRDTIVAQGLVVDDPVWNQDVSEMAAKIQRVAAYPGLELTATIIRDSSENAFAVGGGFFFINDGILRFFTDLARRDAPNDPARQHERFLGYLAAVMGHEVAHVTLGHVNVILDRARILSGATPGAASSRREGLPSDARIRPGVLREARYSQRQELDADRTGALYALLAGGEIQYAMDYWRANDSTQREEGSPYQLMASTYLSSHPRASTREAALEAFRGKLKLHQTRYDDALTLIRANTELDAAIALLDTVLVDFPDLIEARHLRGAAYHQKWLNTVPIQTQRLRSSLLTYTARFLPSIRGAPGDSTLLSKARRDYDRVLAVQLLPFTESNLAVLDAYAGNYAIALRRAQEALQQRPADWRLRNNYGVVLYSAGQPDSANAMFDQAAIAFGSDPSPVITFNQAKTLVALRNPGATAMLQRYLDLDGRSDWRREALTLLGRPDDRASAGSVPLPSIMGVTLGSNADEVAAAMGRVEDARRVQNGVIYRYPSLGVGILMTQQFGAKEISLARAEVGSIDGIRVGDPWSAVGTRWGAPANVAEDGTAFFVRGNWVAFASQKDGVVDWVGMQMNR
ncbi:MAG TPA: M48 family metalloprotease [Gemmatimonadales bacterium]|nr:M48 family metalloprotease [Gemmatimonadales bacterium]